MTPRRWQFIGGLVMGMLSIWLAWSFFNWDMTSTWGWIVSLSAGVLGNAVGEWIVKAWQRAGENDEI